MISKKHKICIFTGSRAEFGLLSPVIKALHKIKGVKSQLIVSGTHLSQEFGMTLKDIKRDGFKIDAKIPILTKSNTELGICHSIGLGVSRTALSLSRLRPDLLVILGDRYESFAAATAALVMNIPIAHLYGGEITSGAIDDAFRHSITKMSTLHFTSTEQYRRRVIQLGENPLNVYNVGALGVENIFTMKLFNRLELENKLGIKFLKKNLLITFHPVTKEGKASIQHFKDLLKVLDSQKDTRLIFTKSNADAYGKMINKLIDEFVFAHPQKASVFASMGQKSYLSTMQYVDGVIGNSSSGIIEAPSFHTGTINIGERQEGRIRAKSVIDCAPDSQDIHSALRKLYSPGFQKILKHVRNPFQGNGYPSEKIARILINIKPKRLIKKSFHDL